LDVLVLVTNPTYPGILIEARPIGLLKMSDGSNTDNKVLCVARNDPRYSSYKDIKDIEKRSWR
jgi:inorganic pyrophosphatase